MWKIPSIGCVVFAVAGMGAGCSEEPTSSGGQAATSLATDDTSSRSAGDLDTPRDPQLRATSSGPVAVNYVVDPSGSAQVVVSAGVQAAPARPASSPKTSGAVRRELK